MKKNDFILPAVFLLIVIFLFVIPISAFLTSEVIGVRITKPLWDIACKALKDHGSLIAGIIGFLGVILLVWSQKQETKKILENNFEVMRNEAFEARRLKSLEGAYAIREKITSLYGNGSNNDFYFWNNLPQGQIYFDDIKKHLFFIESFLRGRNEYESYSLGAIKNFIMIYSDPCWLGEKKDDNYYLGRFIFLLGVIGEIDKSNIESHYFHFDPYPRSVIEEDPKIFSMEFERHNSYVKMQHIMAYMVRIVVPDLISNIDNKAIS